MIKSKKIKKSDEKRIDIYQFYLRYGFNQTIDEIAHLMGITRKTFYNRYKSRECSIEIALNHSHQQVVQQFNEKVSYCNHSIEELMLLIWEFQGFSTRYSYYYVYDRDHELFATDKTPFLGMLKTIIRKGQQSYQMVETFDEEAYYPFFFYNLNKYIDSEPPCGSMLLFILMPLLNDRGRTLLEEMNLFF